MFGKRTSFGGNTQSAPVVPTLPSVPETEREQPRPTFETAHRTDVDDVADTAEPAGRDQNYFHTKSSIFSALIDSIDLSQLAAMDQDSAREEIRDIVAEIIALKNFVMSIAEQEDLLEDICNDVLGYGPLEPRSEERRVGKECRSWWSP